MANLIDVSNVATGRPRRLGSRRPIAATIDRGSYTPNDWKRAPLSEMRAREIFGFRLSEMPDEMARIAASYVAPFGVEGDR